MAPEPVNVLLVEDSPSDAVLLQESLTQNDFGKFNFTHVETLAEAVENLRKGAYDVLLLDLSLPDITGRDTFLRARAESPHIPIVVLTSVQDEVIGLDAVRHGIQDYLIKGQAYGRQTARAIRYAIERKRTETALKNAEAALQQERNQLEARVLERTHELTASNNALQSEIAQRHRAEQAHQQVLRRLAEAEETERGRISRELHDRLGQELTALKLNLQLLRKQPASIADSAKNIIQLEALADSLMRDVHRLAWELRPPALDDLGLELALQRYTSQWSEKATVPVDFYSHGLSGQRLPLEYETTLYRVTQEALTNISRHAAARHVSLLLERRSDLVSLVIEDDGSGFDAETIVHNAPNHGSLGLLGMQERVKLVGGALEIESAANAGTSIFVRLPLHGPVSGDW